MTILMRIKGKTRLILLKEQLRNAGLVVPSDELLQKIIRIHDVAMEQMSLSQKLLISLALKYTNDAGETIAPIFKKEEWVSNLERIFNMRHLDENIPALSEDKS